MQIVTAEQMRALDRRTMDEYGVPAEVLMERAGAGVADVVRRLAEFAGYTTPGVLLIAGRGNNGGDVYAAAAVLHEMGMVVHVLSCAAEKDIRGAARKSLEEMKARGIQRELIETKEKWENFVGMDFLPDIIVDGVLGTGSRGPARGPAAGAIHFINRLGLDHWVVSVDIPSGLNADTGEAEGEAVMADITATMGLPKKGLIEPPAIEYTGVIEVVDIGIPEPFVEELAIEDSRELIHPYDLQDLLPRRRRAAHKGDFGHVLLIGGARNYTGAMVMAARGALRSGAGLVSVLTPESLVPLVAAQVPEAMVHGAPENDSGSLSAALWTDWRSRLNDFDALLIGPGMTRHNDTLLLARQIIRDCDIPMVMDADAINVFAGQPHWIEKAGCEVTLTPHPGELARLFGQEIEDVQKDRGGVALASAKYTGATIVLKGAGTIVAREDRPIAINLTGNPGMAAGGSGDVLAGMITALIGQGLAPYDAARLAVYVHGHAGDLAAWRKTQTALMATDIIEEIPYALRDITIR